MNNETHADFIKTLGEPYYEIVVTDYSSSKVLETLGYFFNHRDAETFCYLWNKMKSIEDDFFREDTLFKKFEEE